VRVGIQVEILYEPVKIGFKNKEIFVEVHPDVYGKTPTIEEYAFQRLQQAVPLQYVSLDAFWKAVEECTGVPVVVGTLG
jgi:L,D-transpeptidase ErfK/SrfK